MRKFRFAATMVSPVFAQPTSSTPGERSQRVARHLGSVHTTCHILPNKRGLCGRVPQTWLAPSSVARARWTVPKTCAGHAIPELLSIQVGLSAHHDRGKLPGRRVYGMGDHCTLPV